MDTAPSAGLPDKNPTVEDDHDDVFEVKWLPIAGAEAQPTPICLQNRNGPCPLLAIANALLLRGNIHIVPGTAVVAYGTLVDQMIEYLWSSNQQLNTSQEEETKLNFQHALSEVVAMLPNMRHGADVNVRFDAVDSVEPTRELVCFDLFQLRLLHGWVSDPDLVEIHRVVGSSSFNGLMDLLVRSEEQAMNAGSAAPSETPFDTDAEIARTFLDLTCSQLTDYGLNMLRERMGDGELAVFFRNNHFMTAIKNQNMVYLLVSDFGYKDELGVVWECLDNIHGNTYFVDSHFRPIAADANQQIGSGDPQLMEDEALARALQEEDDRAAAALNKARRARQQGHPGQHAARPTGSAPASTAGANASTGQGRPASTPSAPAGSSRSSSKPKAKVATSSAAKTEEEATCMLM
ncbi:Ubiquitin carboxyl-terminal hydrolase MINDY-1 [Porphyridium purpureum]|uniref:Ubiquitin carboxyl-terminal hydrolase MINDY-1 n=1 Tax=Porphyridium purpureum TaxID=35688 RepID=A0A5J4YQ73_PORPP|nr:Ubiquitin carboxyl-terminal hydrolase MINDY-1 [Porphyridium purpureum]|eukprot:POR5563..scf222_8